MMVLLTRIGSTPAAIAHVQNAPTHGHILHTHNLNILQFQFTEDFRSFQHCNLFQVTGTMIHGKLQPLCF